MPDVIVNAAAYTNVEKAELEQDLAFAVNSHALVNICEEIDSFNREHRRNLLLIHFSTDYVFDGNGNTKVSVDFDNFLYASIERKTSDDLTLTFKF